MGEDGADGIRRIRRPVADHRTGRGHVRGGRHATTRRRDGLCGHVLPIDDIADGVTTRFHEVT